MTSLEKRLSGRESALPAPELVSLPEDPIGPENVVEGDWWTAYGGKLDADGMIVLPRVSDVACPHRECPTCRGVSE